MKLIPLTQGQFAIVDHEDFDSLSKHRWYALKIRHGFVACRTSSRRSGKRAKIYMHRVVLDVNDPAIIVDHKNHNTLDNRRGNLRQATAQQNRHNSRKPAMACSTEYLGVSYDTERKAYRVQLSVNGKPKKFGSYSNPIDAAKRYNEVAIIHYGEFANLNKV